MRVLELGMALFDLVQRKVMQVYIFCFQLQVLIYLGEEGDVCLY